MANFHLFLVIYPLNHEENSEKFERQFFNVLSHSATVLLDKNSICILFYFIFISEYGGPCVNSTLPVFKQRCTLSSVWSPLPPTGLPV